MSAQELNQKDKIIASFIQLKWPRRVKLLSNELHRADISNKTESIHISKIYGIRVQAVSQMLNLFNVEVRYKEGNTGWIVVLRSTEKLCNTFATDMHNSIAHWLYSAITPWSKAFQLVETEAQNFFCLKSYIKGSERRDWELYIRKNHSIEKLHQVITTIINSPFTDDETKLAWKKKKSWLKDILASNSIAWQQHNDKFIQEQSTTYRSFFKSVESSPLTEHQTRAALVFDDANLTLAAAGSGKTSVMVAKIGYALASNSFTDREIIALAYNKKAQLELEKRIPEKLSKSFNRKVNIKTNTFHALGSYLLGNRPDGKPWNVISLDSDDGTVLFNRAYHGLIKNDSNFREVLLEWVAFARYSEPEIEASAGDLEEHERRYMQACMKQIRIKKEKGARSFEPQIPTFKSGIKVRSIQEARIVNWLYFHGVVFHYEKQNWDKLAKTLGVGKTKNGKQKPYCPDFTYIRAKDNKLVYHEHFGINEKGKAPEFIGGVKYEKQVRDKRNAFKKVFKSQVASRFFETCSGDFYNGSIFQKLEERLNASGVLVKDIDDSLVKSTLQEYAETNELTELFIGFISTFRDSGLSMEDVYEAASKSKEPYRSYKFLKVIEMLIPEVERVYSVEGAIEFSDMLSKGIKAANEDGAKLPYKFILVDEFQDSSKLKIELVKAVAKNHEGSVIFFVGDDWQAINRFAGSDIGIFQKYLSYDNSLVQEGAHIDEDFRSTHVVQLPDTFRYPQGIADVSKEIVLKNPSQVDKPVSAKLLPKIDNTIRVVEHADSTEERFKALEAELNRIATEASAKELNGNTVLPSVFVLTRNTKESVVPDGMQSDSLKELFEKYKSKINITRTSIHSSKGLEADFTIVIGLDSGFKGFPSEISSDPLFDLVLPKTNGALDEERRLFYVALTRSKQQTVLLTAAERPSCFIKELKNMKKYEECFDWKHSDIKPDECPFCKIGYMRKVNDNFSSCTRFPVCGYSIEGNKK